MKVLFYSSVTRARAMSDHHADSFGDDWDETVAVLRTAGYDPGPSTPGAGAVVAFDEDAGSVVLGRDLSEAEQYIDAVHGRIHPDAAGALAVQ